MTDSAFKKSKQRRHRFDPDFNRQEDFLPADLQIVPDDAELAIVPLVHVMAEEDAIDRLLVNSGFDTQSRQADDKLDDIAVDDLQVTGIADLDEFAVQNNQVFTVDPAMAPARQTESVITADTDFQLDDFIADYFDKRSDTGNADPISALDLATAIKPVELEPDNLIPALLNADAPLAVERVDIQPTQQSKHSTRPDMDFQLDNFILDYFEKRSGVDLFDPAPESPPLIDKPDTATAHPEHTKPVKKEPGSSDIIAENRAERLADNAAVLDTGTFGVNQLRVEPETINKQQKNHGNKAEKANAITYVALGVSVVALISIAALGMMVYDMKNEVAKLTGLLAIIKEDIEAHAVKTPAAK